MRRVLFACAVMCGVAVGAIGWPAASPAHACSLAPFTLSMLGQAGNAEVVAIGTLGAQHGAAIELKVEEYFKAPASRASILVVRNLIQTTTPSCEAIPTRVLAFEPGVRLIVMLERDTDGLGANWRPLLVRGFVPIDNDAIESFDLVGGQREPTSVPLDDARKELSKIGPAAAPDPSAREAVPQAARPVPCLAGPLTVPYLSRTAPVIALGKVERANETTAEVRIERGFLGASDGQLLKIDNRHYQNDWDIDECDDRASTGPRFQAGQELLMFLRSQDGNDITGYRGAAIGSNGIYFPTGPESKRWQLPNNTAGGLTLEEAVEVIEGSVAARPATTRGDPESPGTQPAEPGSLPAAIQQKDDRTPLWIVALVALGAGLAGGAAVAFGLSRWRSGGRTGT